MPDMKPEEVVKIFEDGADYWRALKSPAVAHHIRSHDSMAASIRSLIAERDARDLALEDARETIQGAWPEDPLGDSFDLADAIDRLIAERDQYILGEAFAQERLEKLGEALEPFGEFARAYADAFPGNYASLSMLRIEDLNAREVEVIWGHFERARKALGEGGA